MLGESCLFWRSEKEGFPCRSMLEVSHKQNACHAAWWEGRLPEQSAHAQGCASPDLAWTESWPSLSQYRKLSHRRILWCEGWAHTDIPLGIMNHSIWWKAEASLKTICAFSIVVTTKLKALCESWKQIELYETVKQFLEWVFAGSEASAGRLTLG